MLRAWRAAGAALAVALSLNGCGGGGGGGDDGLVISLSQDQVTIQTEEGAQASGTVTATISGSYNGDVYVGAQASTDAIDHVEISFDETHAYMEVVASRALAKGTYAGQLEVSVCADAGCTHHIGGSPFTVDYSVEVHPGFKASPDHVDAAFLSGERPAQAVAVQLPDGLDAFTAVAEHRWLEVVDLKADAFSVRPSVGLSSGVYSSRVLLSAGDRTLAVPVEFSVSAPPGGEHDLVLDNTGVTLTATEGGIGEAVLLRYTPPTWDSEVQATVEGDAAAWLKTTPVAGGLELVADASALAQGSYSGVVQLHHTSWAGEASFTAVAVALTVGPGLVRPSDGLLSVSGTTTVADLGGTVPIRMADGPVRTWTAVSDKSWLVLDTPGGQTGSDLSYHVDRTALAGLANGASHVAQVTVTAQPANIAPVSFLVVVDKFLPEVRQVAPFAQPAGRSNQIILRGVGFMALGAVGTQLTVEGSTISSMSVLNDREVRLVIDATAAPGRHDVTITNGLGEAMPIRAIELFAPVTRSFAKLPSDGIKRGLLLDPVRQAIYTVDATGGSVVAWRYDGTTWVRTTRSLAALADIGQATDASSIIATSTDGTLYRLDPASLAIQSSHVLQGGILKGLSAAGLAVTNDGRVWVTQGDYWGVPYTFDLASRTFAVVPTDYLSTTFYQGPWSHASRNGERLVMSQSAGVSPTPPMLYLDAKDNALRVNPAGLEFYYQISQSDDGQRLMLHHQDVYDGDFSLIGHAPEPEAGYYVVGSSLSPDGRRAYMLAYSENQKQTVKPRVYVLDTSQAPAGENTLQVLGSFDLEDYATCTTGGIAECPGNSEMAVSADGRTLFVAGRTAVLVAPIPITDQSALGTSPPRRSTKRVPAVSAPSAPAKRWPR